MNKLNIKLWAIIAMIILLPADIIAKNLRLDGGFSSNMIIQRDKEVRIFGSAPANQKVTVKFAGQTVKVIADANERFLAVLKPLKANAQPQSLKVMSGKEKIVLKNVLIGDVWLCGGQSNMEYNMGPNYRDGQGGKRLKPLKGINYQEVECNRAKELGKKSCPLIRSLLIEKNLKTDTLPTDGWKEIDAETIINISACAYFFAKSLSDSLNVPVGIITSCWGGSKIEGWMEPEYTATDATVNQFLAPDGKMDGERCGYRYNHMIKELAPMAMQGIIWYQGCANLIDGPWTNYNLKQISLLNGWCKAFNDDKLGFYYVQLAPFDYSGRHGDILSHTWRDLADFRALQLMPEDKYPFSGMALTIDLCDNITDIHPTYKWEIGRRLALQALNKQFGRKDIICDGPRCINITLEDKDVICTFDQQLTTNDGKDPIGFMVRAGSWWSNTKAKIEDGNKVRVKATKFKSTYKGTRYAWEEAIVTNLCNLQGLPAIPFYNE